MEENYGSKISNIINLPSVNVKSQLNINIDSNTSIKQILNIETCLIDCQTEPMLNKALIKGTIGIKIIYIDMDNMYNTLSDSVSFNETINSDIISLNCELNITNSQFIAEFDNDDKSIRVNIDGVVDCLCNLNSSINTFNHYNDDLIIKKSILQANRCVQKVNKTASYDFDFKLGVKINKVLSCDSKVIVNETKCYDGYILINGEIINTIIYEVENTNNPLIKITNNSTPFKCEIESSACDSDCFADVTSYVNIDSTQITTDITDNDTQFNFEYCLVANGYVYKTINIDVVEDLYSVNAEVEAIHNQYTICKKMPYFKLCENVDSEITLADELNVDEILGMVNTSSNITQYSIKNDVIVVEGVINGNMLYLDENKEIKHLSTQIPYVVNIKQEIPDELCALNLSATPTACKCKIKRGNTLVVDYELCISGNAYTTNKVKIIDNINFGKSLNYDDIAFQIYIARPNESCWDLCKRLHTTPEKLNECNKENPAIYLGGEKVIVYR